MSVGIDPFIECIWSVARELGHVPESVRFRARFNEVLVEFGDRRLTLDGDSFIHDKDGGIAMFRELVKFNIEGLF